jgi:small-conductance mechanosensitive channel
MIVLSDTWRGAIYLASGVLLGLVIHYVLARVFTILASRTKSPLDDALVKHCRPPSRVIMPLLICHILLPATHFPAGVGTFLREIFAIALILSVAWLIVKLTDVLEDVILAQHRIDVQDNLKARRIVTQIKIFKKIVVALVSILTLGAVLMTFDQIRQFGASILASAGIAGIIVGFAAQRSIAALLAGIQIALTQPIRLDDVVIVENEWGRIEEITLTYVVVRIWDLRRLILPITYFLEKPFQNWTRVSADLLGTVFIYTDYTLPIHPLRETLQRILKASNHWDGKACALQVTGASERTLEIRALVSAADASHLWEIRCEVREKLIEHLKQNHAACLPKARVELDRSGLPVFGNRAGGPPINDALEGTPL